MYINLITIDLCPGQGGGGVKPSGSLEISENGVYDVYSYASASVDVHPSTSLSETYISNGNYNITGEFNGGVITVDVPISGWDQKNVTEGTIEIINLDNSASFVTSNAFIGNTNIQTVNLPYATSVGSFAFQSCFSLTQVSLPICSYIGENAFEDCSSLSQISLPMCSYIGNNVFMYCSLTQVSLPVCHYIGAAAFQGCSSLSQVNLPMCREIDNIAFRFCSSLSIIIIGYSGVCTLPYYDPFNGTLIASGTGSIYVPASLVDVYKSARDWSKYSSQIFSIPS